MNPWQLPGDVIPGLGHILERIYGRAGLRAVGHRLVVTRTGDVFVVRSGRVTAIALVRRSVLAKPGALQAAIRLSALG